MQISELKEPEAGIKEIADDAGLLWDYPERCQTNEKGYLFAFRVVGRGKRPRTQALLRGTETITTWRIKRPGRNVL